MENRASPPAHTRLYPSLTPPTLYFLDGQVKDTDVDLYSTVQVTLQRGSFKGILRHLGEIRSSAALCAFAECQVSRNEKENKAWRLWPACFEDLCHHQWVVSMTRMYRWWTVQNITFTFIYITTFYYLISFHTACFEGRGHCTTPLNICSHVLPLAPNKHLYLLRLYSALDSVDLIPFAYNREILNNTEGGDLIGQHFPHMEALCMIPFFAFQTNLNIPHILIYKKN